MSGAELPRLAKMLDEGVEQDGAVSGALIGEPEEAGLAPSCAPTILDFEGAECSASAFDGVVVTAEEYFVAAKQGFPALVRHGHELANYHVFEGAPTEYRSVRAIIHEMGPANCRAIQKP